LRRGCEYPDKYQLLEFLFGGPGRIALCVSSQRLASRKYDTRQGVGCVGIRRSTLYNAEDPRHVRVEVNPALLVDDVEMSLSLKLGILSPD
jgi:hypothetical protein